MKNPMGVLGVWAVAGLFTAGAHAQSDDSDKDNSVVEEIVVTGSYIKRDNFDSPSPVAVIDQLEIQASATSNMADIIFNMPQNLGTEVLANPGGTGTSASSTRTGGSPQGGSDWLTCAVLVSVPRWT